jgi:hypothetical protein
MKEGRKEDNEGGGKTMRKKSRIKRKSSPPLFSL